MSNFEIYLALFSLAILSGHSFAEDSPTTLLLEDFSSGNGASSYGTKWKFYSDQVMGGVSEGKASTIKTDQGEGMRLEGTVKLENNGGFIQIALPLKKGWSALDASRYEGIRIRIKGNGETYGVHIRTNQTILPWRYFSAEFETTREWQTIEIPFKDFAPDKGKAKLNRKKLKRIGIVAAFKEMEAKLDIARVELYQKAEKK
jgi:hypothetical protein